MKWPDPSDYHVAIQCPRLCFEDAGLRNARVTTTAQGLPRATSGNFASVYQLIGSHPWAVRCFLRRVTDRERRYLRLSRYLSSISCPCFVGFQYLPAGIRIQGTWYPILKMEWVEGLVLSSWIQQHLGDQRALRKMAEEWRLLVRSLRWRGFAHGDLQHGNVMVTASSTLRLVDYDGVFVPALRGGPCPEVGHENYQHPRGTGRLYDEDIDSFASVVVYLSLLGLAADPDLWSRFHNGDNLVLKKQDFVSPARSEAFGRLRGSADAIVCGLAEALQGACGGGAEDVPDLEKAISVAVAARRRHGAREHLTPRGSGPPECAPSIPLVPLCPSDAQPVRPSARGDHDGRFSTWTLVASIVALLSASSQMWLSVACLLAGLAGSLAWRSLSRSAKLKLRAALAIGASAVVASVSGLGSPPDQVRQNALGPPMSNRASRHQSDAPPVSQALPASISAEPPGASADTLPAAKPNLPDHANERVYYDPPVRTLEPPVVTWAEDFRIDMKETLDPCNTAIRCVAFSHGGTELAIGYETVVRVCSLEWTAFDRELVGHSAEVYALAYSPDDQVLASGGFDGLLLLWDAGTGALMRAISTGSSVDSICFSPGGAYVVAGCSDGSVNSYEVQTGRPSYDFSCRSRVYSVAISPDGRFVAAGCADGSVQLRDAGTAARIRGLSAHHGWVLSLAFSPASTILATGGKDDSARLWSVRSGALLHDLGPHSGWADAVTFSPDGKALATGGADGVLRVWDVASGDFRHGLIYSRGLWWPIQFSPGGTQLACGDASHKQVSVYSVGVVCSPVN